MHVFEFFSGIGGLAAALVPSSAALTAFDIDRAAALVYQHNFPHLVQAVELSTMSERKLAGSGEALWWMSPPCQPYTQQGKQRDWEDRRCAAFRYLLQQIAIFRPRYLALENVPPFAMSRTHAQLIATLNDCGYEHRQIVICPTQLGIPNRRRRFYLIAARDHDLLPLESLPEHNGQFPPIVTYLDAGWQEWRAPQDCWLVKFGDRLHVVRAADCVATRCFTAAYGKSALRSGSYLHVTLNNVNVHVNSPDTRLDATGADATLGDAPEMKRSLAWIRHFSPREIVRLLGFPESFRWPAALSLRQQWALAGNSLSVPVVRYVLRAIPDLRQL